jgi:hypothetical protein
MANLIVVLDRHHLEQPLFMKLFGQKIRRVKSERLIILHADSAYTQRLIDSGSDAEKAIIRSTKEINLKLVNLLAENGHSAASLHGYHKQAVFKTETQQLVINPSYFLQHPETVITVCSNLVLDSDLKSTTPTPLGNLAVELKQHLCFDGILCFAQTESLSTSFKVNKPSEVDILNGAPEELVSTKGFFHMTTIADFDEKNVLDNSILL